MATHRVRSWSVAFGLLLLVVGCGSAATTRADEPPAAPTAVVDEAAPSADPCADLTVRFDPDTVRVRDADRAALYALGDCVRDGERSVTVACHEGGEGTEEYAFALSDRLARAVAAELASRGVTNELVFARAHGNALPLCREATAACHEQNRRCELSVAR